MHGKLEESALNALYRVFFLSLAIQKTFAICLRRSQIGLNMHAKY